MLETKCARSIDVIGLRVVKGMLTGVGHRGRQQATGADPSRGGGT